MTTAISTRPPDNCAKCGHYRQIHPGDGLCRAQGCVCFFFQDYAKATRPETYRNKR